MAYKNQFQKRTPRFSEENYLKELETEFKTLHDALKIEFEAVSKANGGTTIINRSSVAGGGGSSAAGSLLVKTVSGAYSKSGVTSISFDDADPFVATDDGSTGVRIDLTVSPDPSATVVGTGRALTVAGTANRITSSAGAQDLSADRTWTIDIAGTYVGQTSITTLGTITTGVWTGTTIAIANGGTGQTTALAAFNALSPLTTLGDTLYNDGTDDVRLAGNTTTTRKFLRQTGSGVVSAAPAWDTLLAADVGSAADLTLGTSLTLTAGTLTGILLQAASINTIQGIRTTDPPQFARLGIGAAADSVNLLTFTQAATAGGTPSALVLTGGAHTASLNAELIDLNFNLARTVQFTGTTTLATQRAVVFQAPTYSSDTATKTITTAATVAITGAPIVGTNVAITNRRSLLVETGISGLLGGAIVGGEATTGTIIDDIGNNVSLLIKSFATGGSGITVDGGTDYEGSVFLKSNVTGGQSVTLYYYNNTTQVAVIGYDGAEFFLNAVANVPLNFSTNNSTRMSISAAGVVSIANLTHCLANFDSAGAMSEISHVASGQVLTSVGTTTAPAWSASPTLTGLTLSGLTAGSVVFAGTSGVISQDNANFFWDDSNNRLGINTTSPDDNIQARGNGAAGAVISIKVAHTSAVSGGFLGYKARGDFGSETATQANDNLFALLGRGHDGTNYSAANRVAIILKAAEAFTSTAQGTYITLETTPTGSTTRSERMRVDDDGNVGIGTTTPDAILHTAVNGSAGGEFTALILGNKDFTAGMLTDLIWQTDTDGASERNSAAIKVEQDDANSAIMSFWVDEAGLQQRMTILNTGNIGIGTTTAPSLLTVNGLINMKNYTVATLPAGTRGDIAYVTDALAPTFLAVLVGGGAVVAPAFYNGTNWVGF